MHALRYAFDEALTSLWRGRGASLLSVITIAVALVVLGALLLITTNLDRMAAEFSRAAELSVYLADDVTSEMRQAIEGRLAPGPVVDSHLYVSKEEAAKRFRQTFADLAGTLDTLEANGVHEVVVVTAKDLDALRRQLSIVAACKTSHPFSTGQERLHNVAAQEPAATRNKCVHHRASFPCSAWERNTSTLRVALACLRRIAAQAANFSRPILALCRTSTGSFGCTST